MTNTTLTTIVTGAAGGIGEAVVGQLLGAGRHVTALDRSADGLERLASKHEEASLHTEVVDLAQIDDVVRCAASVRAAGFEAVGLVNNAGIMYPSAPLATVPIDEWQRVLDINLTGAFTCMQQFAWDLRLHRGAVVNISSVVGLVAGPMRGAYSPSKAGIIMLTQQAALEWAPEVRVNAVCPGLLVTPLSAPQYADPDAAAGRIASVPMRRVGTVDDIADAVSFLLSDAAGYITGVALPVDGGIAVSAVANMSVAD